MRGFSSIRFCGYQNTNSERGCGLWGGWVGGGETSNVRALKYTLMIFWTSIQVKVEIQKKQEVKIHFVASSTIV